MKEGERKGERQERALGVGTPVSLAGDGAEEGRTGTSEAEQSPQALTPHLGLSQPSHPHPEPEAEHPVPRHTHASQSVFFFDAFSAPAIRTTRPWRRQPTFRLSANQRPPSLSPVRLRSLLADVTYNAAAGNVQKLHPRLAISADLRFCFGFGLPPRSAVGAFARAYINNPRSPLNSDLGRTGERTSGCTDARIRSAMI